MKILQSVIYILWFGYQSDLYAYYYDKFENFIPYQLSMITLWLINFILLFYIFRVYGKRLVIPAMLIALVIGLLSKLYTQGDPIFDFVSRILPKYHWSLLSIGAMLTLITIITIIRAKDLTATTNAREDVLDDF